MEMKLLPTFVPLFQNSFPGENQTGEQVSSQEFFCPLSDYGRPYLEGRDSGFSSSPTPTAFGSFESYYSFKNVDKDVPSGL